MPTWITPPFTPRPGCAPYPDVNPPGNRPAPGPPATAVAPPLRQTYRPAQANAVLPSMGVRAIFFHLSWFFPFSRYSWKNRQNIVTASHMEERTWFRVIVLRNSRLQSVWSVRGTVALVSNLLRRIADFGSHLVFTSASSG
jgi:hypothetical protein